AAMAGAEAVGAEAEPWRRFGERLGEAYQVADDIRDVLADCERLGKPAGRDAALGRPSAAAELGLDGAIAYFEEQVAATLRAIPACQGAEALRALVVQEAARLLPADLLRLAA
ncbi:MAG: polyprenyl synthetase family protein, partial [Burkholderiaceae bacterium]|nr:polyprenyl synthetase family protein [Burkholderiaceae bacterium]